MISQQDAFRANDFHYCLDLENFSIDRNYMNVGNRWVDRVTLNAIWFNRKKGLNSVSKGTIHQTISPSETREEALRQTMNKRGRVHSNVEFTWDGINMWGHQATWDQLVQAHDELAVYHQNYASVPHGYSGWYSLKGR